MVELRLARSWKVGISRSVRKCRPEEVVDEEIIECSRPKREGHEAVSPDMTPHKTVALGVEIRRSVSRYYCVASCGRCGVAVSWPSIPLSYRPPCRCLAYHTSYNWQLNCLEDQICAGQPPICGEQSGHEFDTISHPITPSKLFSSYRQLPDVACHRLKLRVQCEAVHLRGLKLSQHQMPTRDVFVLKVHPELRQSLRIGRVLKVASTPHGGWQDVAFPLQEEEEEATRPIESDCDELETDTV